MPATPLRCVVCLVLLLELEAEDRDHGTTLKSWWWWDRIFDTQKHIDIDLRNWFKKVQGVQEKSLSIESLPAGCLCKCFRSPVI